MNTPNDVAREAGVTFIIFLVVANLVNWVLGVGFNISEVIAGVAVYGLAAQLFGYSIGYGFARTRIAASEEYGTAVAKAQAEAERFDLRESLDESGKAAFDLLEEAIQRQHSDAGEQS